MPIAVIAAMPEELAGLRSVAERLEPVAAHPFAVVRGRIEGVDVLLAECGIGKVNAAALTQALLGSGAQRVIMTGVAGGVDPRLAVGDIVVSVDAVQHDVDVRALGYEAGRVPGEALLAWPADPLLHAFALAAATEVAAEAGVRALSGRVASGDQFVADPERVAALFAEFGAACAEMEGAAVAQVCARWGAPFVIVRSVSDTADHAAEVDFRAFTVLAADRSVAVVRGTLRRVHASVGADGA
ncbi:5'-methylthioadenosine/adenosylhomocysteine nucleosidase [soil metagenome]